MTSMLEDPLQIAARFSRTKVLVVGDAMLDRYTVARARERSPELPVLDVLDEMVELGGAACVAAVSAALGAEVHLAAMVGDDEAGARLRGLASVRRVGTSSVVTDPGSKTTTKTRLTVGGVHRLRVDDDNRVPASAAARARFCAAVLELRPDVLVISDYLKGALDDETIAKLVAAGRRVGAFVVVDSKRRNLECMRGADVFTPSEAEFRKLLVESDEGSIASESLETLAASLTEHRHRFPVESLVVTCGDKGLLVEDQGVCIVPGFAVRDADPVGAGDAVAAVLGIASATGMGKLEASFLAAAAGSLMASKFGTTPPTLEEFAVSILCRRPGVYVDSASLAHRVSWWRNRGLRIGFTNGCFDLLHPGHVAGFNELARHVDRIVVAINADASVQRLKGPSRPICDQLTRSAVVGSLAAVDSVTIFSEDTPERLVREIRPDVLAKGADYAHHEIVGSSFVRSYGGQVLRVPLLPHYSTSRLATLLDAAAVEP